jgi:hypothetical protein
MRRAPSCLLATTVFLCVGALTPEASAQAGLRNGGGVHHHGRSVTRPPLAAPRHRIGHRHRVAEHRHTHGFKRFAKHRHRFFPHHSRTWPYLEASDDTTPLVIEQGQPSVPYQLPPAIPSLADLPVSAGIGTPPVGSPTVYVLNAGQRPARRTGAKVLSMDGAHSAAEKPESGPRIIHLSVPRGW